MASRTHAARASIADRKWHGESRLDLVGTPRATVRKADLVKSVASEHELSKRKAGEIVDLILDEITVALKKGNRTQLVPFSSFVVRKPEARDPKTYGGLDEICASLEKKLGHTRLRSLLEAVDRETAVLSRSGPAISTELQGLRAKNAASIATLRGIILQDALSSDEVRAYVGRSRPVINKMAKDGRLLAITDGRALRFPKWQFDDGSETGVITGLRDVLAVMDASSFRKAAWLITKNPALHNDTPLNMLRLGNVARVLDEAKSLVGS